MVQESVGAVFCFDHGLHLVSLPFGVCGTCEVLFVMFGGAGVSSVCTGPCVVKRRARSRMRAHPMWLSPG